MTKNISILSLGDHFAGFIDTQIQSGRYESASDVVRAGLRLLEEHEAKVKALQNALIAGEQSGSPRPFDFEKFKARKRSEFGQKQW
ncbi:MAG: type II toxin-antitoxin system ParD family antitoxin [Gammaproteobacteria bacterium]|nr:type II toxin-antitoxin system ParD family antitoxin [Gammaproteobacteria bacterium]MYD76458.1 type II toxin-antitoxin system ParD family antitoxin [Gammaproteobacteria bacterium]